MTEFPLTGAAPSQHPRRLDTTQALSLKGFVLMSFLAASSVPSPLYGIYRM